MLLTLSPLRGSPLTSKKSSGIRQSKIYKCQLTLMGVKGLRQFFVENNLSGYETK